MRLRTGKQTKGLRGQIILETAIVLVSLAIISIASVQLFSHLNRNMLYRQRYFRNSRVAAFNNSNTVFNTGAGAFNAALDVHKTDIDPITYLNYSPFIKLGMGNVGEPNDIYTGADPGRDNLSYEGDPRIDQAEALFTAADLIFSQILPEKVRELYYTHLKGDSGTATIGRRSVAYDFVDQDITYRMGNFYYNSSRNGYTTRNSLQYGEYDTDFEWVISKQNVRDAIAVCDELVAQRQNFSHYDRDGIISIYKAFDLIYEDENGVDRDGDGHVGALGLLQQVLNDPVKNGPFDPRPDRPAEMSLAQYQELVRSHLQLREQFQLAIDRIRAGRQTQQDFMEDTIIPKLGTGSGENEGVKKYLQYALNQWDAQYCREDDGWGCDAWGYTRVIHLIDARMVARQLVQFLNVNDPGGGGTGTISAEVQTAYDLLGGTAGDVGSISLQRATQARSICQGLLGETEVANQPALVNSLNRVIDNLTDAIDNWTNVTQRQQYLTDAKAALKAVYDIVR